MLKKSIYFLMLLSVIFFSKSTLGATSLSTKMKGRILLQVEDKGQAWYVVPGDEKRVYLGRPADAFAVMKKYGLGVNNDNFDKINKSKSEAKKFSGRILIKVEDHGKAYYIYPKDNKLYYLGTPADAFLLMRTLGLGITNENLEQIESLNQINTGSNSETFLDSDGDGISDEMEKIINTDPESADTDEDGYDDYVEISSGYNPLGDGKLPANFNLEIVGQIKSYYSSSDNEFSDEGTALAAEIEGLRTTFDSFPVYTSGYSISAKEKHLVDLINDYRESKKLSRLPVSKKLSFTGKIHLMDLAKNKPDADKSCDKNSWSNAGTWETCCHSNGNNNTDLCMTSKPEEVTGYNGLAYENVYWVKLDYTLTPELVFNKWKGSNLVLNKGNLADFGTSALGVAIYGNWAAMWVGNSDDGDNIEGFSDCSIIDDSLLMNECSYDNASYLNDNSYCAQSSDSVYQEDCEIRSDLYQCNGLGGNDKKDCQMGGAAENKRVCNYIYTKAKQISSCYYYNDYAKKETAKKLTLKKGRNDISFTNTVHQTIGEFASLSNNITEIKTTKNGEYVSYTGGVTNSLNGDEKFEPYKGYAITTSKTSKIVYNREIDLPKQNLSKQLSKGTNLVGFSDNVTAFKYQLNNDLCSNYTISQYSTSNKAKNIISTKKPSKGKAYEIACAGDKIVSENEILSQCLATEELITSYDNFTGGSNPVSPKTFCYEYTSPKNIYATRIGQITAGRGDNVKFSIKNYVNQQTPPDWNTDIASCEVYPSASQWYDCTLNSPVKLTEGQKSWLCFETDGTMCTNCSSPNEPIFNYYFSTDTNQTFWQNKPAKSIRLYGQCKIEEQTTTASKHGEMCTEQNTCSTDLQCKPSGRYAQEKYCCLPTECASVIPGTDDTGTPGYNCVAEGGHDTGHGFDWNTTGEVLLTCRNGAWVNENKTLTLKTGWNIVSFEKQMTNTIEQITQEHPEIIVIRTFDKNGASTYDPAIPAFFNDLDYKNPFIPYQGYQIKVSSDTLISLKYTDVEYDLNFTTLIDGWNLIGFQDTTNSFKYQLDNACPIGIVVRTYLPGSGINDTEIQDLTYDSNVPDSFNQINKPEKNTGYWLKCVKQTSGIIPLYEGWNLISVNKNISESIENLAQSTGNILVVRNFNSTGAHTYDPNIPAFFNDLDATKPFTPYHGYWIKASTTQNMKVTHTSNILSQDLSTQLNEGWNLIGFKATTPFKDQLSNVCTSFIVRSYSPNVNDSTSSSDSDLTYDSSIPDSFNNFFAPIPGNGHWVKCVGKK